jgi:hypothetical protein
MAGLIVVLVIANLATEWLKSTEPVKNLTK